MTNGISLRRTNHAVSNQDRRLRLKLDADRCWSGADGEEVRVTCLDGTAWASEAGNPRDILLARGQFWISSGRGKVVVQGLPTADIEVARVPRKPRRWPWNALAAMFSSRRTPLPQWKRRVRAS